MVQYSPFSPEIMGGNPHPVYKQLRDEAPAYFIEEYNAWALSRFEDIWQASMDAEHYSAAQGTTSAHLLTKVQPVTPMLNLMDPPEHTKLRSKIRTHFQPRAIAALEPWVRELASSYLEAARERGEIDVLGDFSSQVAVKVACRVNGIPLEDGELLTKLIARFFKRDPNVDGMTEDGLAAMGELSSYFVQLAQARRASTEKPDDVVTLLTEIEIDGAKIENEAIASHLTMLIIGGAETFPKTFATGIQRLFEHPDQRAVLAADFSLIPEAFMEILRYDMPTQFLCRTIKKDIEVQGQALKVGQPVLFLYPSANRDDREFENPDVFDIRRNAARILSFGHGTHACIGMHIAKLEARVCFEEVLERIPEYELDLARAERLITDFVQGYASMPITFKPF